MPSTTDHFLPPVSRSDGGAVELDVAGTVEVAGLLPGVAVLARFWRTLRYQPGFHLLAEGAEGAKGVVGVEEDPNDRTVPHPHPPWAAI